METGETLVGKEDAIINEPSASARWALAEAKVAALQAKGQSLSEPTDPEKSPTEPAPPEPKPDGEPEGDEEEKPAAESPKVAELHRIAKELGLKVDARGVTKEERYGFRQEKREWQAKRKAADDRFQQQLHATNEYFAPLHPAVELIKAGDWDGAVKKLAEFAKDDEVAREGLNGATKRYLKRAAGEDPRVDELSRWKAQREREDAERQQQEQLTHQQAEEARMRDQFTRERAAELSKSDDSTIAGLAKMPTFAPRVVAYMEQNWDGYETVSLEEAAEAVAKQARAAYDELHQVFGDPGATIQESPSESSGAGRPSKAGVGKKAPKALSARTATEASPPGRNLSDKEWRDKWSQQMKASSG